MDVKAIHEGMEDCSQVYHLAGCAKPWTDNPSEYYETHVIGTQHILEVAEKTIQESADYISMARPFIREPGLAKRWQEGDRSPARCISCNGCFMPGIKEGGIYCVVEKKEQEKKTKNRR